MTQTNMKAVTYYQYGTADVLNLEHVPTPEPSPDEMLIGVKAASVTTADWRIRSMEMPGAMKLIGRLMFGIFGPRNKILGTDIAGDIVAVGDNVSKFEVGQAVFGHIGKSGHAQYAVAKETAAIAPKPASLSYSEAAALPFGGLSALVFLRDFAKVKPGQKIMIVGASGNVGVYAVQIAKALGAHVAAVASGSHAALVAGLGADEFIDYQTTDLEKLDEKYDLVFDTYGAMSLAGARKVLTDNGLFLPLNFSLGDALSNLLSGWTRQQKMMTAVSGDTHDDLLELVSLVKQGKLRPVVDTVFPFANFREAYQRVESRNRSGSIVMEIAD